MTTHDPAPIALLGPNRPSIPWSGTRRLVLLAALTVLSLGFGLSDAAPAAVAQSVSCPCSMWDTSVTPDTAAFDDPEPVEVGVKFRSDIDGYVTALRFYKGSDDAGAYIANLWSAGGKRLGSGGVIDAKEPGWIDVPLAAPVAITARTTYVASYHSSIGRYAATRGFFSAIPAGQGPLHALANGDEGGNGVFAYGSTKFPTESYQATSYAVDVVFNTSAVDTVSPSVLATTPIKDAKGVATATKVTATLTEDVSAGSMVFSLNDRQGAAVPASVQYDTDTRTVTLTPNEVLSEDNAYTASVSGLMDVAGNAMPAIFSWSFSTSGKPSVAALDTPAAPSAGTPAQPQSPASLEPLSVSISSDRGPGGVYYFGESATICVTVNRWASVRITHRRDGGVAAVLFPAFGAGGDDRISGRRCVYEILQPIISGDQTWVVEVWDADGNVASATIPFFLVDTFDVPGEPVYGLTFNRGRYHAA